MAAGPPAGWPSSYAPDAAGVLPAYAHLPAVPATTRQVALQQDTDALWIGVYAAAAGVVGAIGLLSYVAVVNQREHDELWAELIADDQRLMAVDALAEGVNQKLDQYQQSHALVHYVLDAQVQALDHEVAELAGRYPSRTPAAAVPSAVATLPYGAPLFSGGALVPPSATPVSVFPSASLAPTSFPALSYAAPSVAPVPVMSESPTLVELPPHLRSAVTAVMSKAPTRVASRRTSARSRAPSLAAG